MAQSPRAQEEPRPRQDKGGTDYLHGPALSSSLPRSVRPGHTNNQKSHRWALLYRHQPDHDDPHGYNPHFLEREARLPKGASQQDVLGHCLLHCKDPDRDTRLGLYSNPVQCHSVLQDWTHYQRLLVLLLLPCGLSHMLMRGILRLLCIKHLRKSRDGSSPRTDRHDASNALRRPIREFRQHLGVDQLVPVHLSYQIRIRSPVPERVRLEILQHNCNLQELD